MCRVCDGVQKTMESLIQGLPVLVVTVASVTDIVWQRIPNWLTFSAAAGGLALHSAAGGFEGFLFSLLGLGAGFGLLVFFYAMGGMAAGDVKLLSAVGAYLGAKVVFGVFLVSALVGGVYAAALWLGPSIARSGLLVALRDVVESVKTLVLTGKIDGLLAPSDTSPKLRYGVCIAVGTIAAVFSADGSPMGVLASLS